MAEKYFSPRHKQKGTISFYGGKCLGSSRTPEKRILDITPSHFEGRLGIEK